MANDSYGSVSRCRVYVDYIQYAKAIGMINNFSYSTGRVSSNNPEALWDMNPSNVAEFTIIDAGDGTFTAGTFRANFKYVGDDTAGLQFRNLISTTNYGALLGHNVGLFDPNRYVESKVQDGYASQSGILGRNTCKNNIGTNIWKINHFVLGGNPIEDLAYFDRLGFKINKGTEGLDWNVGDVIRMGAFSTGRYFDLPVNANLSVNQTFSYDGVQTKRTFGGADLTQVNHTRKKWGDLGAWTHIDLSEYNNPSDALNNEDYSTAGFQGKRSWDLAWSFISKEDMFPRNFENNMSGYYDVDTMQWNSDNYDSDVEGTHKDNTLGWMSLCCFGTIPFIFQPDNTKTTFAICVLDKPSISIKRVAPDLYNIKMKIVEI